MRWGRFVARTASNHQELDRDRILAEARARLALTMDPRTRIAPDLDIERVDDGLVVVRTNVERPTAQVARDVLERVSGVQSVDIVDPTSPPTASPANPPGGNPAAVPSATGAYGNGG